jgi:chorismate mutase/prephenate dehydratase
MDMDLQKLRGEIDAIDTQMTDLFVRRMGLCAEVARYKKENGMAVVHQGREREILSRISALAGDELDSYARILFSTLFDLSRSYQSMLITEASPVEGKIDEALRSTPQMLPKKAVVACQGVEGGYAQQACDKVFSFADIMYFRSWEGVFSAVQKGLCQYGILPIENSSNGSVNGVYDLMRSFDFHIVRGVKLHVNHSLLACPGADLGGIKEIFSHEQAIGQCSEFLKTLPGVQITVCENTAMAAKLVAESGRTDAAAISSPACAAMYGLRELRQGVHNTDNNYTRFILIAKNPEIYPGADHLSLMFKVGHTPGSLTRVLARFSALGLNMTKLESRPISGADFHYMFYMDFEGSIYDPSVRKLLCELEQELELFVFLGAYQEE